jgi:hypothetical protein
MKDIQTLLKNLATAHAQVENLIVMTSEFEYSSYLEGKLLGVKYELERQIKVLTI